MNVGESLAYWYFRLNGFLPLMNFVLHRPEPPRRYNADSDLLAVRFPQVFEEVGGQADDWDNEQFARWKLDHFNRTVCVIAEIKTGRYSEESINRAFDPRRVLYALRRLGAMDSSECDDVCRRLTNESVVLHREFSFAKVLVASSARGIGNFDNLTPCCHMELEYAVEFIRNRMQRYRPEKEAARMFFPGDLIQFFAWEAGIPIADAIPANVESPQQWLRLGLCGQGRPCQDPGLGILGVP